MVGSVEGDHYGMYNVSFHSFSLVTFAKCLTLSRLEIMGYINGQVQPEGKYLHTHTQGKGVDCGCELALAL